MKPTQLMEPMRWNTPAPVAGEETEEAVLRVWDVWGPGWGGVWVGTSASTLHFGIKQLTAVALDRDWPGAARQFVSQFGQGMR